MIRETPAGRGTETSAEVLVGPLGRMVSNAGPQQSGTRLTLALGGGLGGPVLTLFGLEPPQIDLFWVVPERHHRPRSPQEGPFPGWVPVSIRKKTQMGLQGGLRKSGYFLIPTLMLNLKVKIAADGTKNGILPD